LRVTIGGAAAGVAVTRRRMVGMEFLVVGVSSGDGECARLVSEKSVIGILSRAQMKMKQFLLKK
jgi:hypothetical protein